MNERAKELAILVQRTEMPGVLFAHPDFVEKFFELVVRECVSVVQLQYGRETLESGYHRGLFSATEIIKEHFGVE